MNGRTAKLLRRVHARERHDPRLIYELKKDWKSCPRNVRYELRLQYKRIADRPRL